MVSLLSRAPTSLHRPGVLNTASRLSKFHPDRQHRQPRVRLQHTQLRKGLSTRPPADLGARTSAWRENANTQQRRCPATIIVFRPLGRYVDPLAPNSLQSWSAYQYRRPYRENLTRSVLVSIHVVWD